ncbi:hypothetical protein RIF29_30371 [Crotalaria pallida]|uniref:DUF674 family protein n=1 Tax=Crotalaria pallida TaxID=3830 RepID=A0AAN9HY77_CROPI
MAAATKEEQITLRIVIDEAKNKVVFAEAGKDFVDALLSFLTLPLGTIARLVAKESNMNKVGVGSLSSLYNSVAKLEVKHFLTETFKEMLLRPRNSMEAYCQKLKLNVDDTEKMNYFICENWNCSRQESGGGLLSTFRNTTCKCGKLMNREISLPNGNSNNNEGFVPDKISFIISDDLKVMPENFQASVVLLGIEDFSMIKEVIVNVSQKEAETNAGGEKMKLKVMVRKSNSKILFALAEEDFIDFLFSFLTIPLGRVEHMLKGNSCLGSIDNLYKSVVDLESNSYLRSGDLKDKLVKSQLAHQFKLQRQILPIDEAPSSNYFCYSKVDNKGIFSGNLTSARAYISSRQEGLSILKASLISSSALTNGLGQFLKPTKVENILI